jgi:hypothetical protein
MSIIKKLKDEGALVLYHDYRSRSAIDHSGNDNDGTLTATRWTNNSVCFSDNSVINVFDSAELNNTEYSFVILFETIRSQSDFERLISKWDGSPTDRYDIYFGSTSLNVRDGSNTRFITHDFKNTRYVGINAKNGEKSEVFSDGSSVGLMNDTSTFLGTSTSPMYIGNRFDLSQNNKSCLQSVCILNRKLTAQEHSDLYDELDSKVWPTMPWTRVQPLQGVSSDLWKTHWGVNESVSPTTSGFLENSPFRVDSGSHQISTDTINGKSVKVVECVSAGVFYLHSSYFHQTEAEAAYGEWEICWNKDNLSSMVIQLLSDEVGLAASTNNYNFFHVVDETIRLRRGTTALIDTSTTTFPSDTWHIMKCTRTGVGAFDLVVNGTSLGTVTDNTYTTSKFMIFDLDAGDKLAFSDIAGGHAVVKKKAS